MATMDPPTKTATGQTVMAFQAHHIDTTFYDKFYREGAYTDAHRNHFAAWHPEMARG